MDPLIAETVEALRGIGWKVELAATPRPLPDAVVRRHPNLPPLAVEFLTTLDSCVSPDEGSWLLAAEDLARTGPEAWCWDSLERIFTEDSDDEMASDARAFWDRYMPIFHLVEGDYEYLAIGTDPASSHFGKVVWNSEAAYDDDPLVITKTYEDFLVRLRDVARRDPARRADADITIARLIDPDFEGAAEGWWARFKRRLRGDR